MRPKISVVMAAYNSEKYIAEAIKSILNQTYKNFELIIVQKIKPGKLFKNLQKKMTE